jgi:hypothetical protein
MLQIRRLQTEYARVVDRQLSGRELLRRRLLALDEERRFLRARIGMSEDVLQFRQLLFEQGKIQYDVLIRSKLDLLEARESLNRFGVQQLELLLRNGRTQ